MQQVAAADRASHSRVVRVALAVVGAQIVVLSVPGLVLGSDGSLDGHDARHIGAFGVAYGIGLLLVVHRPARARTMLGVGQVFAAALVLSAVVDLLDDRADLGAELSHLPVVASVVVLWLLASSDVGRRWPGLAQLRRRLPRSSARRAATTPSPRQGGLAARRSPALSAVPTR